MLRRFFVTFFGITLMGLGIALFMSSNLGTDPFTSFIQAIEHVLSVKFIIVYWAVNILIFFVQFLLDRKMIGIGTVMNWVLMGIYIPLFGSLIKKVVGTPDLLFIRFIFMLLGVLFLSFGASLYQTANLGISPYDSLAIIFSNRTKIRYFWARMLSDGICVITCLLLVGFSLGYIGIGSVVCVFGIGPVIYAFNKTAKKNMWYVKNLLLKL